MSQNAWNSSYYDCKSRKWKAIKWLAKESARSANLTWYERANYSGVWMISKAISVWIGGHLRKVVIIIGEN